MIKRIFNKLKRDGLLSTINVLIKKIFDSYKKKYYNKIGLTDIQTAQKKLAFLDSQNFIYENSSLSTLSFNAPDALKKLHTYCLNNMPKKGFIFEFGVYKGKSINFFAKSLKELKDQRILFGFDSWKGFSEEWSGVNEIYTREKFDLKGNLPKVENNVVLIDGYIENSLPKFIEKNNIEKVAFVHIDTDTYTPAKVVLSNLKKYFQAGTIILFDEFCGYPNWRSHEYKALVEVLDRNEYEYLGFAHNGNVAYLTKSAIRIL